MSSRMKLTLSTINVLILGAVIVVMALQLSISRNFQMVNSSSSSHSVLLHEFRQENNVSSANSMHTEASHELSLQNGHDPNVTPDYYMVFSTSCTDQQHWESLVFFFHAYKVGQRGNVTRILSGCDEESDRKEASEFFLKYIQPLSPRFHLHFTPNYSNVKRLNGRTPYKYMNKPFGLKHWMENALGIKEPDIADTRLANSIVMLLDPDMVLLRPLVHDFSSENVEWVETNPSTRVVKTGYPISQQDGYLNSVWMGRNFSHVTQLPEGQYVRPPKRQDGKLHWNSGPPYLATVADMYAIAVKWVVYAPRVLEIQPDIFAEMSGFMIATVQLQLPFTFLKSLVVSTTQTKDREGWSYIDSLPDDKVCEPPPETPLPVGLHYCKRYLLGKWFFSKYRVKKNIMDCNKDLLLSPPSNFSWQQYDGAFLPPRADSKVLKSSGQVTLGYQQQKREAFMLCAMIRSMNEALRHHKSLKCGSDANLAEAYSVHTDPSDY